MKGKEEECMCVQRNEGGFVWRSLRRRDRWREKGKVLFLLIFSISADFEGVVRKWHSETGQERGGHHLHVAEPGGVSWGGVGCGGVWWGVVCDECVRVCVCVCVCVCGVRMVVWIVRIS